MKNPDIPKKYAFSPEEVPAFTGITISMHRKSDVNMGPAVPT